MSVDVATLTISLFVAEYCVGPVIWGPLSEQASQSTPGHANKMLIESVQIGRRPVFIVSFIFYTGFQVGGALSDSTASILIFRLLSGIFAAAPLTNSGWVTILISRHRVLKLLRKGL